MSNSDAKDYLDQLIRESAAENLDTLEPDHSQISGTPLPLVNHPWALLFSWLLCFTVIVFFFLAPLPKQHDLGTRSVETRVSVAMYHVAHHIETYRQRTGRLPDYLETSWQESQDVEYRVGSNGYELIGRSGEFKRTYQEGMDPERLLLSRTKRADSK